MSANAFNLDLTTSQTTKFIGSSKLREYFKFDENGRKFLKRIENTVGKGEIARMDFCTGHNFQKYRS